MPSTVSELCVLRDTVARIERNREGGGPAQSSRMVPRIVPLGDDPLTLDLALGGGLRCGTLHEVVPNTARDGAAAAGFAAALAARCTRDGTVIWIMDDRAASETGTPYRHGLAAYGLDPDKVLLVKTRDAATTLWAAEEALRAGAGVVLTELWRSRSYDLAASRRLLLAARRRNATSLILHVGLDPAAVSSAADTRFAVAARPGEHRASAAGRTPIPGLSAFAVRLLKRRSTERSGFGGFDRDEIHALAWDREARAFTRARGPGPLRQAPPDPSRSGRPILLGGGAA